MHSFQNIFKKLTVGLVIIALFASVLSGCAHNNGGSSKASPDWYSVKMSLAAPINYADNEEYIQNSNKTQSTSYGYVVAYTLPEILERSTVIVRGKVLGFDYLTTKDKDGSVLLWTDYYVEIEDTLRGEPNDDDGLITVSSLGGENDNEIVVNDNIVLKVGQEYLFFLYRYAHGYGSFVENEHCYNIVGGCLGAFTAGDETVKKEDGTSVPKYFTPYTPTSVCSDPIEYLPFLDEIAGYNETNPVDPEYYDTQLRGNMDNNLMNGMVTQEEYDEFFSTMDTYAEILYYTEAKQ